jgi:DNA-nicking Smr family endonuclease
MNIGDFVSAIDEDISGEVIGIFGAEIDLETEDGFVMRYAKSELVVIQDDLSAASISPEAINKALSDKKSPTRKRSARIKPKERNAPAMEVDLHIHQLVPHQKGLSNYDMLNIQMDTAKRQLDFAIHKRIPKVVFIHGKGNGVLKSELEFLFRRYDQITFYDADYQKYGTGATEIRIFQNPLPNS